MTRDPLADIPDDAPILVTGAAGFIGYFLALRLLEAGKTVVGLDNLNPYYDVQLKTDRLAQLRERPRFAFHQADIADRDALRAVFDAHEPPFVVNLAAQAGVRHSIDNPHAYAESNLTGFLNVLEECRRTQVRHLVYASSSSVYGGNVKAPFSVRDSVDHPVSLYAATKKANELMAHAYADLYGLPATGLRFFTVYGPWGRPDMAYFKFAKAIFEGRPIQIYNNGEMERDFTYVDDIVEGVARLIPHIARPNPDFDRMNPDPGSSWAPHRVYNIGNRRKERLMDMVRILEEAAGREAIKQFLPMQPGDVRSTWADVTELEREVGFLPDTPLEVGLRRFVDWYRARYAV
ncbi:NAD-dependent epimerase [Oceanicella actignis]|uniref:UDP-glucuronate 4-epimerase n=1 Tax=Oceanicella actignis TaxID=1189325 RepID=A0A1M7TY24_9RHOB|nr:NAD-dependent epimerase [Oceanicella actignis]SET81137.1 UDP-glucuronate 4-epimerase [Oceanicella actignis]SHN75587.1 UDP-glucuronate 4-epimerase [Oceanicella actignis]